MSAVRLFRNTKAAMINSISSKPTSVVGPKYTSPMRQDNQIRDNNMPVLMVYEIFFRANQAGKQVKNKALCMSMLRQSEDVTNENQSIRLGMLITARKSSVLLSKCSRMLEKFRDCNRCILLLVVLLFGALSAAYKKVVDFKLFKREKMQMPIKNSFFWMVFMAWGWIVGWLCSNYDTSFNVC